MENRRWNRLRFDPRGRQGHVESFFVIGQDPVGERALWLKATLLAPQGGAGEAKASAWLVGVERRGRVWALKDSLSWDERQDCRDGALQVAGLTIATRRVEGTIHGGAQAGGIGPATLDLALERKGSQEIALLFHDVLYELPWPGFKLLTPSVLLTMTGRLQSSGGTWQVDGWRGMQGHNWGRRHAERYGWFFCNTWDTDARDDLFVEAFSVARPGLAGALSGGLAGVVVLYQGRTMHFNGPIQLLRNRSWTSALGWGLRAEGRAGRLVLRAWARQERTACLRYHNPDGTEVFCMNSPLASADLVLELPDGSLVRRRSTRAVVELAGPRPMPGMDVLA